MSSTTDCVHELVRLPMVQLSADYLCRLCYHTFEMRLLPEKSGSSLASLDPSAEALFGGTVIGEGRPRWPDPGLIILLKDSGEDILDFTE